jgi:hypothetical protein
LLAGVSASNHLAVAPDLESGAERERRATALHGIGVVEGRRPVAAVLHALDKLERLAFASQVPGPEGFAGILVREVDVGVEISLDEPPRIGLAHVWIHGVRVRGGAEEEGKERKSCHEISKLGVKGEGNISEGTRKAKLQAVSAG